MLRSTIPIFTDESIFPLGKYRGEKFKRVPVRYLHWIWHNTNPVTPDMMGVHAYIKDNLSFLKSEDDDLIWSK